MGSITIAEMTDPPAEVVVVYVSDDTDLVTVIAGTDGGAAAVEAGLAVATSLRRNGSTGPLFIDVGTHTVRALHAVEVWEIRS